VATPTNLREAEHLQYRHGLARPELGRICQSSVWWVSRRLGHRQRAPGPLPTLLLSVGSSTHLPTPTPTGTGPPREHCSLAVHQQPHHHSQHNCPRRPRELPDCARRVCTTPDSVWQKSCQPHPEPPHMRKTGVPQAQLQRTHRLHFTVRSNTSSMPPRPTHPQLLVSHRRGSCHHLRSLPPTTIPPTAYYCSDTHLARIWITTQAHCLRLRVSCTPPVCSAPAPGVQCLGIEATRTLRCKLRPHDARSAPPAHHHRTAHSLLCMLCHYTPFFETHFVWR
jgi:hypothetical protein